MVCPPPANRPKRNGGKHKVNKKAIDLNKVIKKISLSGWTSTMRNGIRLLRIQPEFIDSRTGEYRNSNEIERFRVEINDINNIQEYCRTNSINIVNDKSNYSVKIIRKFPFKIIKNGEKTEENIYSANFDDFNFRVSLNTEDTISKTGKIGMSVFENWNKSKKIKKGQTILEQTKMLNKI